MAAAVLGAAVALLLVRSTSDRSPSSVDRTVAAAAPVPTPPYDRRPGRTPIAAPVRSGASLSGGLPATGPPARTAAVRAVDLVLGRFCLEPAAYAYTLGPEGVGRAGDWRHVTVLLFRLERGGTDPALRLALDWTGREYRWTGPAELLRGC
ncbi:MAG TPA: hypothetical protein VGP36_02565 [Mycobacteriales bacterium]|nr:hypothetical protein [Mycobacteriales bacterium]